MMPIIYMRALGEVARGTIYGDASLPVYRILTDSRSLVETDGTLFVALTTSAGDGHRYIEELYARGVRTFVVERGGANWLERYPEGTFCQVPSSLMALQTLAVYYRRALETEGLHTIVGITGSNGKTIVKEMLSSLLLPHYPRLGRSPGSYNSQLGVPLSILALRQGTELALLEAGISLPDEMERLAEMIRPTHVILTNIGSAHGENFTSADELAREKLQLALRPEVQKVIVSADDDRLARLIAGYGLEHKVVSYSLTDRKADLTARYTYEGRGIRVALTTDREQTFILPESDTASLHNALLSLTTLYALLGEVPETALARLGTLAPMQMRLELKESRSGTTIINDSYSCDLESMTIALDFMRRRAALDGHGTGLTAILSDIEGSALAPEALYAELGRLLVSYGIGRVYAVGAMIGQYSRSWEIPVTTYLTAEALLSDATAVDEILRQPYLLVKGARRFGFETIVRALSMREHQTQLEVNLSALRSNLAYYRSLLPAQHRIICMIKADAYGLGAYEVARVLQDAGVDYLAVAVADEGKALRRRGITSPIIVMNPELGSLDTLHTYGLDLEVYSLEMLRAVVDYQRRHGTELGIHLKVDTSMHRLGFAPEEADAVAELFVQAQGQLRLSAFSHLAVADVPEEDAFTHGQAQRLKAFCMDLCEAVQRISAGKLTLESLPMHLLNTAGIERFASSYAYDAVRLGIGLYGSSPMGRTEVQPVAQLTTTILQTKWIAVGETVGYGRAFRAERPTRIAILPIGYADGLSRRLGCGSWSMLVGGVLCPIVGRVCMDTCMLDITDVPSASEGDRVIVFGSEEASLDSMAHALGTITYEVLTSISPRVARVYVNG